MARINPEVERLQRHVAVLSKTIDRLHANPPDIPFVACDNSCVCAKAEGMATNGGCRCDERKLRRAVQYWRMVAMHRLAVIDLHRRLGGSDPDEDEVVERIVAWLRTTPRAGGVLVSITSSQDIARLANAIEAGEWREATDSPSAGPEGKTKP